MIGTIIAALLPSLIDSSKNVIEKASNKWIGLTVDDQIKLKASDVDKLKALASLDNPVGTPSQWVVDLRASFRYIAAGVSILAGIGIMGYSFTSIGDALTSMAVASVGFDLISIPYAFVFGDRLNTNLNSLRK